MWIAPPAVNHRSVAASFIYYRHCHNFHHLVCIGFLYCRCIIEGCDVCGSLIVNWLFPVFLTFRLEEQNVGKYNVVTY